MAPNRIAALIDSRLPEGERERLVALIGEAEAAGVLSDAVAALADVEGATPGRVTEGAQQRAARRWHPGAWMALAACIAGILLIPFAWSRAHRGSRGPEQYAMLLVAHGTRIPSGWDDAPWEATRGASDLSADARAFRIGARVTGLGVALRERDSAAVRWASEVASLVDEIPGAAPVADMYRDIATRSAGRATPPIALADSAARAVAEVSDSNMVRVGAWTAAARLAAAAHDSGFFASPESRELLHDATRFHLAPEARDAIAQLARSTNGSGSPDWSQLQATLTQLASVLGR